MNGRSQKGRRGVEVEVIRGRSLVTDFVHLPKAMYSLIHDFLAFSSAALNSLTECDETQKEATATGIIQTHKATQAAFSSSSSPTRNTSLSTFPPLGTVLPRSSSSRRRRRTRRRRLPTLSTSIGRSPPLSHSWSILTLTQSRRQGREMFLLLVFGWGRSCRSSRRAGGTEVR